TAQARATFERAVELMSALPGSSRDLAATLDNLAKLETGEKNFERALTHGHDALARRIAMEGDDAVAVATTRVAVCRTLRLAGRHAEALEQCEHALEVLEAGSKPEQLPWVVIAHNHAAKASAAAGLHSRAATHRSRATAARERLAERAAP
nr:tetratricopeptide repeat protein [Deltaproteobacteria bacterium]